MNKDFEEWLKDTFRFPEDSRAWAWECWKASRKATLKEVLGLPEYFEGLIKTEDIEGLKDE